MGGGNNKVSGKQLWWESGRNMRECDANKKIQKKKNKDLGGGGRREGGGRGGGLRMNEIKITMERCRGFPDHLLTPPCRFPSVLQGSELLDFIGTVGLYHDSVQFL